MALPLNTSSVAALSSATTLIGSLSNLLLASPQTTQGYQPQNVPSATGLTSLLQGPSSLIFHYEGEQSATLSSDITDHFIENNTAIQDQIALKPVTITTHGFIGELNNVPPAGLGSLLSLVSNTLTSIAPFAPALASGAQNAYNQASAGYMLASNAVNGAISAVSSLGGSGESVIGSIGSEINVANNQNKQQIFFQQLYGYWQTRTLFTIQTPWAIFQNMAILTCRPVQSGEDRTITDFEVTFKQMNFASTALLSTQLVSQGRAATQSATNQSNGNISLNPSTSVSSGLATQTAGQ